MGYHAPSAEEVYRYIFRLDGERSLTDRFSWSILFVNDPSTVCQEFLQRYCVDVCLRTADRIRFVFFSDMPEREMQRIADGLNRGRFDGARGLLRSILDQLPFGRRRNRDSDFERDPWRDFRPTGLYPLRDTEEIRERISWECDLKTTIPGYGIAMEFAQKLGIGRYVPCMLVFTDIGRLQVDVLPITNMTADETYTRIRSWVDAFYEVNHDLLHKWTEVEKAIERICSESSQSLYSIREWRSKRLDLWNNIRKLSKAIKVLSTDGPNQWRAVLPIADDYGIPWDCRDRLRDFRELFASRDRRITASKELIELKAKLERLSEPIDIFNFLLTLQQAFGTSLPIPAPKVLQIAISELKVRPPKVPPAVELARWWKSRRDLQLSHKGFVRHRRHWLSFAKAKEFDSETLAQSVHGEYLVALAAANEIPLTADPETAISKVLSALAQHYGVDDESNEWRAATKEYREFLHNYFRSFGYTAPSWLVDSSRGLTFGECLPGTNWSGSYFEFIETKPRLKDLVAKLEADSEALALQVREEWLRRHNSYRTAVIDSLVQLSLDLECAENDFYSAREALIDYLVQTHAKLQDQIFQTNSLSANSAFPGSVLNRQSVDALVGELKAYEESVGLIQYPHLKDRKIVTVPIRAPVTDAVAIRDYEVSRSARSEQLRQSIYKATDEARQAHEQWPNVERESRKFSPAAALYGGMMNVIGQRRLSEIAAPYPGEETVGRVEYAVKNNMTHKLLHELSEREREALLDDVRAGEGAEGSIETERDVTCDVILVELGLLAVDNSMTTRSKVNSDSRIERTLRDKIARNAFDVFIAHNSQDKPAILEICHYLRLRGIYPWVDIEQIPPGRWFQDVIQSAIRNVQSAAIFIGRNGLGKWQALELRSFVSQCVEKSLPVIPVLLPSTNSVPEELVFLRELNCVAFKERLNDSTALERLIWGITGAKT